MNMQLVVLSKLLKSTTGLLVSGYLAFAMSILLLMLFQGTFELTTILMLVSLILVGLHHYLSIRVQLDSALLQTVVNATKSQSLEHIMQELDHSLVNLKLMPSSKMGRVWEARLYGCFRLFKLQIFVLCLQYVAFICIFLLYK